VHASPICRHELVLVGAAHELRTPLTVARGHLELLQRQRDSPLVEVALDELDRLGRIVERMLLIAELESEPPGFEPVRLASLLADATAARPEVRIGDSVEREVAGDEDLLLLALDELLANSLERVLPGEQAVVSARASGDGVEISVADACRGADAISEDVFACFARVDHGRGRAIGGAGLGLAIVRAVAHTHGGRCGMRARDPKPGTDWWLWLPALAAGE
jgi:two-component system OmpR family sensor kinase